MNKRQYYKKQKSYIDQVIELLESNDDYKAYIEIDERQKDYIDQQNLLRMWEFKLFESYGNKELNDLVKKISKLNPMDYKVDLTLRPKKIKDINYLRLEYDSKSVTFLGTIEFLSDGFIREVNATYTQVSNNQIIVDYTIRFNKVMTYTMCLSFLKENRNFLYGKDFTGYYNLDNMIKTKDYSHIQKMFEELIKYTLQAKISDILVLNIGKKYKLPSCRVFNYPEDLYSEEDFRDVFLCETYDIRSGEQFLINDVTGNEGLEMDLYFSGNRYIPVAFINIIRDYRMNFYYYLFGRIENIELNNRMNKYFNGTKNQISAKDYKWLVNKIRAINENKLHSNSKSNIPYPKEIEDWKAYYGGKQQDLNFSLECKRFEVVYNECLEHLKIINALQKENLAVNVAISSFIVAVAGIIITAYQSFK